MDCRRFLWFPDGKKRAHTNIFYLTYGCQAHRLRLRHHPAVVSALLACKEGAQAPPVLRQGT